ncbi:hypothetical protein J7438_23925 [Thalassotalea sp. G20_0]|uniref:hypothetical protein n=1 Tax=Thalassotalea sp. G20_0 TaxID=2821093 RepID=UPI001ADCE1BE|nr:hypothetical protein [Thalassotalea sp. G20_0]MBO9497112.1 hypothetical protein [Thalassotalea sp. G20_0]
MLIFPETEKKLKARISSYRSALNKEKKEYHFISDGSGKRYVLFSLYLVLNDLKKSESYFNWYQEEFPDDAGEPIQTLCWSLGLLRMNKPVEARYKLAELMLANLYLIPYVLGQPLEQEYDIWHASNFHNLDYIYDLPEEVNNAITDNEREWMGETYGSLEFRRVRKRYIEIYHELLTTKELAGRKILLNESRGLLRSV